MKGAVESRLEHGLHLSLCASQQSMRRLKQVQNLAMRIVIGLAMPTPCNIVVRFWLGLNCVKTRQKHLVAQAFLKAVTISSHSLFEYLRQTEDQMVEQIPKTSVVTARQLVEDFYLVDNIQSIEWVRESKVIQDRDRSSW